AGFGHLWVPAGGGAAAGPAAAAEGRRRRRDFLLGGLPRQPGRRICRAPAALPRRAGLRLRHQGRRRPARPCRLAASRNRRSTVSRNRFGWLDATTIARASTGLIAIRQRPDTERERPMNIRHFAPLAIAA